MEKPILSSQLNRKNNFDFLRVALSVSIVIEHFYILSVGGGSEFTTILATKALCGFFIVSGFLITWSYYNNNNNKEFFKKRAKRILPPYLTVVISCALFLSLISILPFSEYFTSPHLFKYLAANMSFMNFIEPTLPGVFLNNLVQAVNGSLWTVKVEIALYICVPLFYFFSKKMNKGVLCLSIYIVSIIFFEICSYLNDTTGNGIYNILGRQFIGQLRYFISGVILLIFFDQFKKYMKSLLCIAIVIVAIRFFPVYDNAKIDLFLDLFIPISLAIIVIGFAFSFKFLNNFGKYGDFSYGIYLSHVPVIQVLVHFKLHEKNLTLTLILTLLITFVLAILSWHLIEKHFLKRR